MNTPSARRRCRPFTIADGMLLVAAVAIASALVGRFLPMLGRVDLRDPRFGLFLLLFMLPPAFLIPLGAFQVAVRLRRPRPMRARLVHPPGFVACIGASASLLAVLASLVAENLGASRSAFLGLRSFGVWLQLADAGAGGALGGWLWLAIRGRRSVERGWIDALGRAVGALWVARFPINVALQWWNS